MKLFKYLFNLFKTKPTPEKPLYTKVDPIKWRPSDKYYF